jgi:hypothetical protein
MITITISAEFRHSILTGKKRSTIRKGTRSIPLGPALLSLSPEDQIPINITSVRTCLTSELTEPIARTDGFDSTQALIHALERFYPNLGTSDTLTIIEFSITVGGCNGKD